MYPTQLTVLLLYVYLVYCLSNFLSCYQLLLLLCYFYCSTVFLKSLNNSHSDNSSDSLMDFVPIRELNETESCGMLNTEQLLKYLGRFNWKTLDLTSLPKEEGVNNFMVSHLFSLSYCWRRAWGIPRAISTCLFVFLISKSEHNGC